MCVCGVCMCVWGVQAFARVLACVREVFAIYDNTI